MENKVPKTYRGKKLTDSKVLARLLASKCVRDTILEDFHSGVTPNSKTDDYSDVKVVSPYGEIGWNKLSRLSDEEMRELMLYVEKALGSMLAFLQAKKVIKINKEGEASKEILEAVRGLYFGKSGVSWDNPTLDKLKDNK
jgi:hypothetical protein